MKIRKITIQEIKYNNSERVRYIGEVLNGVPNRKGIMYWDNGDRYEGEWKNDRTNGKGIYLHVSGNIYVGDFINRNKGGK